jgi:hypothetical protein
MSKEARQPVYVSFFKVLFAAIVGGFIEFRALRNNAFHGRDYIRPGDVAAIEIEQV